MFSLQYSIWMKWSKSWNISGWPSQLQGDNEQLHFNIDPQGPPRGPFNIIQNFLKNFKFVYFFRRLTSTNLYFLCCLKFRQDYHHWYQDSTIEESAWLPFQKLLYNLFQRKWENTKVELILKLWCTFISIVLSRRGPMGTTSHNFIVNHLQHIFPFC